MIDYNEIVTVKVIPKTYKHYISLGYNIDESNKINNVPPFWIIQVKVNDLSKGSHVKVTRTCNKCGKVSKVSFNARQFDYCQKCASQIIAIDRKIPDNFCIDCGKKIKQHSTRCKKCAKQHQSGKNSPRWKSDKVRKCKICGRPLNSKKTHKTGLCKNCLVGENNHRYNKNKLNKYCSICGKLLHRHYKHLQKPLICRSCAIGKHHWSYNIDIPDNEREHRRCCPGIMKFIQTVKHRDGFCKKCGSGYSLEVHHIKAWKYYPDLRLDPDNGILFCHKCHREFHKIYGLQNASFANMAEYLLNDEIYNLIEIKMVSL